MSCCVEEPLLRAWSPVGPWGPWRGAATEIVSHGVKDHVVGMINACPHNMIEALLDILVLSLYDGIRTAASRQSSRNARTSYTCPLVDRIWTVGGQWSSIISPPLWLSPLPPSTVAVRVLRALHYPFTVLNSGMIGKNPDCLPGINDYERYIRRW